MSYLVFARKWRPRSFDEVIGQEHIATTLKNAITLKRVAHAYLFNGPRGIGKTSTARILAKALNCAKGPGPFPCNVCEFCTEISQGRSLDVMEIDGASNRGIEQIRQLRENVKFAPAKSRFKIYIIDEVHQITTDGFNALLKTLEEPPTHVKFIFATTQAHKVLPTILSRCQRFNFKPLAVSCIAEKLKRIIKEEKLDVTEEALLYIARSATGSMRDAESILDQLTAFCRGEVNIKMVTSMLGMIDHQLLWQLAQKIIEKDTTAALSLLENIINEGKDLAQFVVSLMEHFRNILITKIVSSENAAGFIDLPPEHLLHISEQGKGISLEEIFYVFNVLMRTQENLRRALSSRIILEMAILKLTQRDKLSSLQEILTRLTNLEQNLGEIEDTENPSSNNPPGSPTTLSENVVKSDTPLSMETTQQPKKSDNLQADAKTSLQVKELNHNWPNFLQAVKEEKMFVASSLELGKIVDLAHKVLTIAFPEQYNFYRETLERPENKKVIEKKAKEIFRQDLKVKLIVDKNLSAETEEKQKEKHKAEGHSQASEEPIIKSALNIFQGRVIRRNG